MSQNYNWSCYIYILIIFIGLKIIIRNIRTLNSILIFYDVFLLLTILGCWFWFSTVRDRWSIHIKRWSEISYQMESPRSLKLYQVFIQIRCLGVWGLMLGDYDLWRNAIWQGEKSRSCWTSSERTNPFKTSILSTQSIWGNYHIIHWINIIWITYFPSNHVNYIFVTDHEVKLGS